MPGLDKILCGGDLRSIGKSNSVLNKIKDQKDFDELFRCLFHKERIVEMRAADVIEKITAVHSVYLHKHKKKLIGLCDTANNKELKWHLALLIPRLKLSSKEIDWAWYLLTNWSKNKSNSRIVRVNSIQGLFELMKQKKEFEKDFKIIISELEKENVASISARIRILRKKIA